MFEHRDDLAALNEHLSLKDKIVCAHAVVKNKFPFIARIAVSIYDAETRVLKTYLHSSGDDNPLQNYQALLDDAPSLKEIIAKGQPRVVNNLVTFENSSHEHAKRIGRQGYAASYTMPMYQSGTFFGFLFFNSYEKDVFNEKVLSDIDIIGHMISLMIVNELQSLQAMTAAIRTTSHITHYRDPETGSHLDRMSRYSRVIARELAGKHQLNDDYIEHIFMFAPLHDIGKIAIPDHILLKPGTLDPQEAAIMRTHATRGREMIDEMIRNFGLDSLSDINVLRNIAQFHHEAVNGSGYPEGRQQNAIPLEARIVAVADVFDALTTRRPYKEAWSNEQAIATLQKMAGEQLDADCVAALIANMEEIRCIQEKFAGNEYG